MGEKVLEEKYLIVGCFDLIKNGPQCWAIFAYVTKLHNLHWAATQTHLLLLIR